MQLYIRGVLNRRVCFQLFRLYFSAELLTMIGFIPCSTRLYHGTLLISNHCLECCASPCDFEFREHKKKSVDCLWHMSHRLKWTIHWKTDYLEIFLLAWDWACLAGCGIVFWPRGKMTPGQILYSILTGGEYTIIAFWPHYSIWPPTHNIT